MTLKFDCACGTRIGFDVEPDQGRMPQPLSCPSCGTDLTETANREIAAHRADVPSGSGNVLTSKPAIRVARTAPAAKPPPTVSSRDLDPSEEAVASEPPQGIPSLRKHSRTEEASHGPGFLARNRIRLAALGLSIVVGYTVWFQFVGSKPRPIFVATTPANAPFLDSRLLDRDRLLVLTPTRISVRSLDRDVELWGTQLQAVERPKPASERRLPDSSELEDPDYASFEGEPPAMALALGGRTVWVRVGTRLTSYDLSTGKAGTPLTLPPEVIAHTPDDAGWTFQGFAGLAGGAVPVARLDFAGGDLKTGRFQEPRLASVLPVGDPDEASTPKLPPWTTQVSGGTILVGRLLETVLQGGGPEVATAGDSVFEKENLRARDSGDVARKLLRPTDGSPVENLSRYEVTLLRPFGGAAWKGTVTGQPVFVPLKTIGLLVAGKQAIAFDPAGNRLWQATLGALLQPRHLEVGLFAAHVGRPAREGSGRIYLYDRSTVTALNAKTGDVAWRLPTVGASEVVEDGRTVYVATTTAGLDLANHPDPTEVSGVKEVVMAVDAASGTVRWISEKAATHTLVGNPGRYTWRAGTSRVEEMTAAMDRTRAIPTIQISRIDPETGKADWIWFQKGTPFQVEVVGTRILVQRPREITVLDHRVH